MGRRVFERRTLVRDICLIAALALIGLCLLLFTGRGSSKGSVVQVAVDGEVVLSIPLSRDGSYSVNGGSNTIEVKDGRVSIVDADCPDRLCVRQGWIDGKGQSIVCLPNRVIVTVVGGESSIDFVL